MSTIGSYPTRTFKESQKFLVLDPDTQSASLVSGRDLVDYITPSSDSINIPNSKAPASSGDTSGDLGDIAWSDGYIYVKTSTGWKRSPLTTF